MMDLRARAGLWFRSLFLQACWNDAGMQNIGFAFCMDPWLRRLHPEGGPALEAARRRHLGFFNTQPHMSGFIVGVAARQEEELARCGGEGAAAGRVNSLKAAMGSALAGVGDSLFWGALKPLAAVTALLAAVGLQRLAFPPDALGAPPWPALAAAAAAYLAVFNGPAFLVRWLGIGMGHALGEGVVARLQGVAWRAWVRRLRRAGLAATALLAGAALLLPAPGVWESPWVRCGVLAACLGLKKLGLGAWAAYVALAAAGVAAAAAGL